MQNIPFDTSVRAEYSDGFVLDETEHNDVSPYTGVHNILNDIAERRPEVEHGRLAVFSVFYKDRKHSIDWQELPESAKPCRFRDGFLQKNPDGSEVRGWSACRMGYEYVDEAGGTKIFMKEL